MRGRVAAICLWGALLLQAGGPAGAAEQVHGESSEYAGRGVALAWAILKAPVEDQSQVVVRLARLDPALGGVSLEGVDPFSGERRELLPRTPLPERFETRSPRGGFAELTRREFHFYPAAAGPAGPPSLTIYFLGVPDTAPEFLAEAALTAYLDQTLARLIRGKP